MTRWTWIRITKKGYEKTKNYIYSDLINKTKALKEWARPYYKR